MFRKIICILSAAGMLFVFPFPVHAADLRGSIRVVPDWAGNRIMAGEVALYRIGDSLGESYRITDGLANWIVSRQEVLSDEFLPWAVQQPWENGRILTITDEQGAFFSGLGEGLYLVVQTLPASGFSGFAPFLITLPAETGMDITVNPQILLLSEAPRTGDYPAPIFAAMVLSLGAVILMVLAENRRK